MTPSHDAGAALSHETTAPEAEPSNELARSIDPACDLSGRALNVLKLLASEMTGENPPRDWIPSDAFLCQVTFECLVNARNCGPLTTQEIIRWAASRGIAIAPPCWAGKSFPQMWRYLEVRFATGELTPTEIAEILERSVRRKNVRIPVAVQRIFLKLLGTPSASRFGPQISSAMPWRRPSP